MLAEASRCGVGHHDACPAAAWCPAPDCVIPAALASTARGWHRDSGGGTPARILRLVRRLVLGEHVRGDAPPVGDLETLAASPRPDVGAVLAASSPRPSYATYRRCWMLAQPWSWEEDQCWTLARPPRWLARQDRARPHPLWNPTINDLLVEYHLYTSVWSRASYEQVCGRQFDPPPQLLGGSRGTQV